MSFWGYLCLIIVFLISFVVFVKNIMLKKSIKEIKEMITFSANTDTNSIITVSSSDKDIKKLANTLNIELKKIRKKEIEYKVGNQELKKIITNISHDLRTPLTAIKGYIDLIKNNNESDKQYEYMEIIERKTNDVIVLTEQLFDFSKTMDLEINIKKEKNKINNILEEAIANYYVVFKEKNIKPKIEITEKNIYRNIDRNTILRVFENILSNVYKYSNGDFKVVLDENGKIIFSNKATSLDATTVEKIFNRYYTVQNAKKSTGVGLSIAKQLVELNGGTINAKYIKSYLIIEINL